MFLRLQAKGGVFILLRFLTCWLNALIYLSLYHKPTENKTVQEIGPNTDQSPKIGTGATVEWRFCGISLDFSPGWTYSESAMQLRTKLQWKKKVIWQINKRLQSLLLKREIKPDCPRSSLPAGFLWVIRPFPNGNEAELSGYYPNFTDMWRTGNYRAWIYHRFRWPGRAYCKSTGKALPEDGDALSIWNERGISARLAHLLDL